MKRGIYWKSMIFGLILALGLVGCSSNTSSPPSASNSGGQTNTDTSGSKGSNAKYDFVFHTGSQGGGYMAFGAMFAQEWQKQIPGFNASTVSGGSFTNMIKVEQSKTGLDMGATLSTVLQDGVKHQGDFSKKLSEPVKNVQAIARLNRQSLFLAPVLAEAVPEGVTTVGQFLAKKPKFRMFTKDRGTGGEIATRKLLEAYGLTYQDIESWGGKVTYSSTSDGVSALVDGHAEAVWQTFVPHAADLQELESSRDVVYLEIEDEIVQKLKENYGYFQFEAPADWFKAKKAVKTFMEDTVVFVHKDAPEDVVYQMTKIVLQKKDAWTKGQKAFETFEPENAWKDTLIPLHPGAEKAYKELGYMK